MPMPKNVRATLEKIMQQRILILDGAMGTMIIRQQLEEVDYRGHRFQEHTSKLKGNNSLLTLTKPDLIAEIHRQYLEAGSDIIETNTLNSNVMSMQPYQMADLVYELNFEAAKLAKAECLKFSTIDHPRFVAGSIGPTSKSLTKSDASAEEFDEWVKAYKTSIHGLMDGGCDILLLETIFDVRNAEAALLAMKQVFDLRGETIPIIIAVTIVDDSGRLISGHTIAEFYQKLSYIKPLAIGFNCSLGLDNSHASLYIKELAEISYYPIIVYANAGFPDPSGKYDLSSDEMAEQVEEWGSDKLLNIVGGCCGTTPEHIRKCGKVLEEVKPREVIFQAAS